MGSIVARTVVVILALAISAPTGSNLPSEGAGRASLPLYLAVTSHDRTPDSGVPRPSVQLVLGSISRARCEALSDALARFAEQLEMARDPLVEDLSDDDARVPLDRAVAANLSTMTAAAALVPGEWSSADHDMTVRLTGHCPSPVHCYPLRVDGPISPTERRARFLAWPLAFAMLLAAPTDDAQDKAAEALREAPIESTRIALVLRETDLHKVRFTRQMENVVRSAGQVVALLPRTESPQLRLLADLSKEKASEDPVPWLSLPRGSILVVPRLSALGSVSLFIEEVRARIQARGLRVSELYIPPPAT